jgi:hypothetical protein
VRNKKREKFIIYIDIYKNCVTVYVMTFTKLGKNQYFRDSGAIASKDNRYFYWKCTISSIMTFASAERFKKLCEAAGSEDNLVKNFVCREAKKYLAAGWKATDIAKLVTDHKGDLPKLNPKVPKNHPDMPKKVKKARLKAIKTVKVVEVVNGENVEVVKKTYPWSDDPQHYFGGDAAAPIDYSLEDTCHRPNYYLDSLCHGCPLYDVCGFKGKHGPTDYLDAKKTKRQVVVKVIQPFTQEEIEAEKVMA